MWPGPAGEASRTAPEWGSMCARQGDCGLDSIWFDDIEIGYSEESDWVAVDRTEMVDYAAHNDPWPIHTDVEAASLTVHGDVIASFGFVVSLLFRAMHTLPSIRAAQASFLGALEWRVEFLNAVFGGDLLRDRITYTDKRLTSKGDRGVVTSRHELLNQDDQPVVVIGAVALHLRRPTQA